MNKVLRVEYAIMRNGEYVVEVYDPQEHEGITTGTKEIEEASTYPSAHNARKFVEDDMRLNIQCVSIHKVTHHAPTIQPLVLSEGSFVDINSVCYCEGCSKWFNPKELIAYQHDIGSDKELLCQDCYEEMTDKYPNILVGGNSYE